ncbi:MAG TPA: amino acid permease [Pirellulales bacterium]|nr:amino acid permease [Pirellulales bacterium]
MTAPSAAPRPQFSLVDATSLIVGIIIGSGVYRASPVIASQVGSPMALIVVWLAGGAFALLGALCYAELATTYPVEGGDFVYLSQAFGRPLGFVYAWCQLWIIRPGSVGAMAFVFATYARQVLPLGETIAMTYALAAVAGLCLVNIVGVRQGKWTQNVLSGVKVAGLAAIVILGIAWPAPTVLAPAATSASSYWSLALILVVFTYSGWNEMPNVAAEVRDPRRNILRALLTGTLAVTAIYLLVTVAFLRSLGFAGLRTSEAVAADVVAHALGPWGATAVSLLICISALGAINGMTITGSRLYYAFGRQHAMFRWLGRWSPRLGTPVASLVTEAVITSATIAALAAIYGTDRDGFERLIHFTAPLFWIFLTLVAASLPVLRQTDAARDRPFRVPLYPAPPIVLAIFCALMAIASLRYAWENRAWEAAWALGVLGVGMVLACADALLWKNHRDTETPSTRGEDK